MSKSWKSNDRKRGNFCGYSNQKRKRFSDPLTVGVKGFMLTCNMREIECIREAYNILNEYYDKLYRKDDVEVQTNDFEKQLEDEINDMKVKPKIFKQLSTNCKNVLFVYVPDEVDPIKVSEELIKDIHTEKSQKTRHLLRFIPVIKTCKATVDSIEAAMREILATRKEEFVEYMIACKVRNNDDASSQNIIGVIANIVKQEKPQWKVKFDNPTLTINADVVCKMCCLGFLTDFAKNKKYNLVELSQSLINDTEIKPEVLESKDEIVLLKEEKEESQKDTNSCDNAVKLEAECKTGE